MNTIAPYRRLARQVRAGLVGGPPGDEDHNIWHWYLSTALLGLTNAGLWTFLPIYLARLGASATVLGLFTSLPALLNIVLILPGGILVEQVRDQMKGLLRLALVSRAMTLCLILSPFFVRGTALPIVIVLLWTALTIPDAGGIPLWTAIAARSVSVERRAHVNGTRWALLSLVTAVCMVLYGRWLDVAPVPWAYEAVFMASFVGSLFELWFFARIRVPALPPPPPAPAKGFGQRLRDYLHPLTEHRPFLRYLAATFAYRLALCLPLPLFTLLWVRELRASDGLIGLRGTVGSLALMLGYFYWGRRANRIGHRRVLWLGAIGLGAYVVISALLPSAGWIVPVAVLWGVTASGVDVGIFDLMLDACPQGQATRFASVAQAFANLAVFLGPLLGVALAGATSIRTAILVAGILQVASTAAFLLLPEHV